MHEATDQAALLHNLRRAIVPAIDRDEYLIEMPACVCGWMRSSELSGVGKVKFYRLAADGFIGDIAATLGQQILDIPKAQRKS